jgi:LytS/YehU family sensor histidine kinase
VPTTSRARLALLIVGLWTLVGLASTQLNALSFGQAGLPFRWQRSLGWNLWSVWLWAAFTPLILWLVRRWPIDRRSWARAVPVHLAALLLLSALDAVLNHLVAPYLWPFRTIPSARGFFLQQLLLNSGSYMLVAALAHAGRYAALYRDREVTAAQLQAQLASARLAALQAQLHPHFLFNTLNAIAEQVHVDADAADQMILKLGALLRASLQAPDRPEVPLREELELVGDYLELMRLRLCERLEVRVAAAPELLDAAVPPLLLQPLVENAIRHGIERRAAAGRIDVAAHAENGRLVIEVRDDGAGLAPGALDGVGIRNTRDRLRHLYGDDAVLALANRDGGGAVARLEIPLAARAG